MTDAATNIGSDSGSGPVTWSHVRAGPGSTGGLDARVAVVLADPTQMIHTGDHVVVDGGDTVLRPEGSRS